MKSAGYATAIFGKWHVGNSPQGNWAQTPQLHGFDSWRAGMPSNVARCGGSSYWKWLRVDDGETTLSRQYNTIAIRDAFLDWWRETEGPRFAYVAFQAPHLPLHLPPERLLAGAQVPADPSPRQLYQLMLISLDHVVGEIMEAVNLRETLVIFLGDNGTPPEATRPDQNHSKVKTTTFEDGINVPMIIAGLGIPAHGMRHDVVHAVDLMATISELVGIELPEDGELDSIPIRPHQPEPELQARPYVFSSYIPERIGLNRPHPDILFDEAVVARRYKLRNKNEVEELYDLERDPGEHQPLDLSAPDLAETVQKLRRFRAEIRHGTSTAEPQPPTSAMGL
jgi:arylsulfatase A-like enzyme